MFAIRTIIVEPYNSKWPLEFEKINSELLPTIGNDVVSIEHVGSTAVPGLWAKSIIDLNIVVERENISLIIKKLSTIGYIHEGDLGIKDREAFCYCDKTHLMHHHLYVCPTDSAELERQIKFRDYLRKNPDDCEKYSNIKIEMAKKYPYDIDSYIKGKEPVVMGIYSRCGVKPWKEELK